MNTAQNCINAITEENNRTFGVEIEFTHRGVSQQEIARVLNATGIVVDVRAYTHSHISTWKLVTDSSISGAGSELVSPVLSGKDGLQEVKTILDALNTIPNVNVNKSCGLHVHHGIPDATPEMLRNLVTFYGRCEELIDEMVPPSRRANNNRYCRSMTDVDIPADVVERGIDAVISYMERRVGRYTKVNLLSYRRYRTVEYRQHSGTTDPNKVIPRIIFTQTMVEKAGQLQRDRRTVMKGWMQFRDSLKRAGNPAFTVSVTRAMAGRMRHFRNLEATA